MRLFLAMNLQIQEVPPYNGYGSLEDSLQNCLALVPKRPKKDVLKMLEKSNMVLRYSAKLVSQPGGAKK